MSELNDDRKSPPEGTMAHCAMVLGVSSPYLSKLKKQGRIHADETGRWDPDTVRAQIESGRDPANIIATVVRNQSQAEPAAKAAAEVAASLPEVSLTPSGDPKYDLLVATALEKQEHARIAQIERMEKEKSICLVADVDRTAFTAGRLVRDAVMRAVTKISPILAPITDTWELERQLADAMRAALTEAVSQIKPPPEAAPDAVR